MILGIVAEKPQSAYDIQKDIEYHHLSRWTKISIPSIYRKVLQLSEKGYLRSDIVKGDRFADKAVYSITDEGKDYFNSLMQYYATQTVPLLFDFNVVIANLNKLNKDAALDLISKLKESITVSVGTNEEYLTEYSNIPLVGKTIIEQQGLLYKTLLEWLDTFREQFERID
ncbi:PadR family transcriptional regulator [Bifidobacterium pseudocatenulatum]|uniref:PadR family transcriptional regulator n=1 Tax=Bifidobacterium pseudocatenulatum TaxID=28026 RepID=UPI0022E806CB|nr:PadR family transcriptional regulator [Bifidobacterium pseudocatenulatum]